jgi:CRISPR-associated protein Cmr2
MGATLDAQVAQADHELLSERLSTFAAQALQIVSGHDGALVYAGGDDVLALLPLDTALDCARKLHAAFAEAVNPTGKQAFVDRDRRSPTLSAGIAICHQIEPLNDALRLARDAEHKAKDVDGKDALAIVLSKRSGADVLVVDKWGQLDERLAEYTACHLADELPDGAAFQLRDLAQRLAVGSDAARIAALGSAAQAEAIRILGRKQRQRGTEKIKDPQRDGLVKRLEPSIASIRGAADELIVARLLAEATRLAAGKE